MNLAEAFSTLAKTGCRLRVEAGGVIILDVLPGHPPVPPSVLQVLAAHQESLAAVLAPTKLPKAADALPAEANPKTAYVPASPYARDLPLKPPAARAAVPAPRPQLDLPAIRRQVTERLAALREQRQSEAQSPECPTSDLPPAMGAAREPSTDDDITF